MDPKIVSISIGGIVEVSELSDRHPELSVAGCQGTAIHPPAKMRPEAPDNPHLSLIWSSFWGLGCIELGVVLGSRTSWFPARGGSYNAFGL